MATPGTVSFHTLGCKLNFAESSSYSRMFEDAGFQVVPFDRASDVCVINTCSVTEFADKKCRNIVRRVLRNNPDTQVIVVGCYAQLKPNEIASIPGVDLVLGAAEKFRIMEYVHTLAGHRAKGMVKAGNINEVSDFHEAFSFGDRTRTFLKVQDGCNYNCSFCTIPLARGFSRSPQIESLVRQAEKIAAMGCIEIVLTGVNIGDFGLQLPPEPGQPAQRHGTFEELICALDQVQGIERFRISSIEPNLLTDDIIGFVAASRAFMPHFHLPLQSGNDRQLALMRRRYRRNRYQNRVETIRSLIPHAAIGVDVIAGFPGESDDDFLETLRFIESLDVTYLHAFTYSERSNTPAATMPGSVSMNKRRKRNEMLRSLSAQKTDVFNQRFIQSVRPVLVEDISVQGEAEGYTDNYIRVRFPVSDPAIQVGDIVDVQLKQAAGEGKMSGQVFADIHHRHTAAH